ncbi:hypothetical protein C8J57DRAFT_1240512 [Mycena rebaudengoi]|nr:hypothetical protein C8J57DRAFT_1240512 [Mycena rebaudengoi]
MSREVNGREAVKETRRILELAGFRGKIEGALMVDWPLKCKTRHRMIIAAFVHASRVEHARSSNPPRGDSGMVRTGRKSPSLQVTLCAKNGGGSAGKSGGAINWMKEGWGEYEKKTRKNKQKSKPQCDEEWDENEEQAVGKAGGLMGRNVRGSTSASEPTRPTD